MKSPARIAFFALLLAAFALAACGAAPAAPLPAEPALYAVPPAATQAPAAVFAPEADSAQPDASNAKNAMPGSSAVIQTGTDTLTGAQANSQMIIKTAEVRLLVENADTAIDRALQMIGDVNGYIISSRAWYQPGPDGSNYKYATLTIGVPVDQFETAMRRLRTAALKVEDENASGQDVSDEYVDLQSQLGNLEATRDRIRSFLNDAKTVDESLRINQELSNIEAQIEQVKGRMNYLSNRSAFSTITITFEPDIPPVTPTPTATPTATATPQVWNPGQTVNTAAQSVTSIYQSLIEVAIWLFIVIVPLLAPPALIIWGIYKLVTRKKNKTSPEQK